MKYHIYTNARRPPRRHVCQRKMHLFKSKMTPPPSRNISLLQKYLTINCIHLINKTCQILSTLPVTVTISIFTVSAFIFLAFTPNIPVLFIAIPQHIIISSIHCVECTAILVRRAVILLCFTLTK